ncbi:MAG: hypothetical protein HYX61_06195 [Gammaproteobacteria bacterium]|jgi:hypothetical protein|nr:hypothetical protein [Gammaproteobacteria bacterium]
MSKVIVLQLDSLVDVKIQRSIDAYVAAGISKFSILWHSLPLPKWLQGGNLLRSIDRFGIGDITPGEFRKEIAAILSSVSIPSAQLDKAWNAQCVVTAKTKEAFTNIESLEKAGYTVYVISGTNPLHKLHIEEQYGKKIPGIHVFSYEKGRLGKDLFENFVLNTLRIEHADLEAEDIIWLAKQPEDPHPGFGTLGWLLSPIQKLFFHKSEQEYADLARLEQKTGLFTLMTQRQNDKQILQPLMTKLRALSQERGEDYVRPEPRAILHQRQNSARTPNGPPSSTTRTPNKSPNKMTAGHIKKIH